MSKEKKIVPVTFRMESSLFDMIRNLAQKKDWSVAHTVYNVFCAGIGVFSLTEPGCFSDLEEVIPDA